MRTTLCLGGPLDGLMVESEDGVVEFNTPLHPKKEYDFRREVIPQNPLPTTLVGYRLEYIDKYTFWKCLDEEDCRPIICPIIERLIAGYRGTANADA